MEAYPVIVSQESAPGLGPVSPTSTSYLSLPHKPQLLLLMLTRMTESLVSSSIQSYIFFQLRYFDQSATFEVISAQAGLMFGAKTAAHVLTGMFWGRLADSEYVGRKPVLVFGLLVSAVTSLGYGLSTSFVAAIAWQILDGALNSTVPMVRCIIAELNPQKRQRARALTLLPLCTNAGHLLGPLIGGFLVSEKRLARGVNSNKSDLFDVFPFLAPNIVLGAFHAILAILATIFLQETLQSSEKHRPWMSRIKRRFSASTQRTMSEDIDERAPLIPDPEPITEVRHSPEASASLPLPPSRRSSFSQIWTFNVVVTLAAYFIIHGHMGTFPALWALFLSSPVMEQGHHHSVFSGGLGMDPRSVGVAMSLQGAIGVLVQVLVYPTLNDRMGSLRLWRSGLLIFPLTYFMAPLPVLTNCIADASLQRAIQWTAVVAVLFFYVCGRSGVAPANTLLINESAPDAQVRATVHTAATIVSSLTRSVFPPITLLIFGYGLRTGASMLGFWFLAGLAALACVASLWVVEGNSSSDR